MMQCSDRLSVGALVGLLALPVASGGCFTSKPPTAGFWFEDGAFVLPADVTTRLGGPLAPKDIVAIQSVSSSELTRAFSGLRITVSGRRDAFWRVAVVDIVPRLGALPSAGQSFSLGALGGTGSVGLHTLARSAVDNAPAGASRQSLLEGIGRGIGRAAAHEFAHQILGPAMEDDRTDLNSYEYFSSDRQAQFYGELRWISAWALLQKRLGG